MSGVAVTGATTPLGLRLTRSLLARGVAPVVAIGAEVTPPSSGNGASGLHYLRLDLTRPRETHDALFGPLRELGVSVLVHAALHRRASDVGPKIHAQNVESTRQLLSLSERHPTLERFVFLSSSNVYRVDPTRATLISEDDALELSPDAPQSVRDRVEADLTVCTRMGMSRLGIVVVRCAEILAANVGSQLFEYLEGPWCLRPLGFNPMLNVLSLDDAARALLLAALSNKSGVFNIPGKDTLPLSRAVELWGKRCLPVPGPLLAPLYRVRASARGMEFQYDLNYRRFHFSAVLDGSRAGHELGYEPEAPIAWPAREHLASLARDPSLQAG